MKRADLVEKSAIVLLAIALAAMAACGGGADAEADAAPEAGEQPPREVGGLSLDDTEEIQALVDELGGAMPDGTSLGETILTVNGEPVYAWQLFEATRQNLLSIRAQGADLTEAQEMEVRAAMIQLIVMNEVLYQDAIAKGHSVTDEEVDQALADARNAAGGLERFEQILLASGIGEDEWRQRMRRQIVTTEYRDELARDIQIDEAMLREYYESNPELYMEGEEVDASFILVKCSPDDPEGKVADARARIEEAKAAIDGGMSFADAARRFSQADNAAKGGKLGFFGRGNMVPAFEKVVFELEPGEVSDIVRTPFGFNLITVHERKEPTRRSFDEVKPELMLEVATRERSRVIGEKMTALVKQADVQIVNEDLLRYRRPDADAEGSAEAEPAANS